MPRQARLKIQVAAGVLRNAVGEVLLAERLADGPFNGLWEFPGGKIKTGETSHSALQRELLEELGITIVASEPFLRLSHVYDDRAVDLQFFLVDEWRGEPAGLDGQQLRWVAVERLDAAELLPADAPLVAALQKIS
ncbi:MAG: 8-oxo-dGTP diphosphatase MutT [Woeseiaceae bacterium]